MSDKIESYKAKEITFSVIIPVYNGELFIKECLNSVLSQSHPAKEIIVVDDGSQDSTSELLATYETETIKVLRQTNKGQGAARNVALRHVSSEFVLFLDADDKLNIDTLKIIANKLKEYPETDVVHFNWQYFSTQPNGKETYEVVDHDRILSIPLLREGDCDKLLTITNYFCINNVFRHDFLKANNIRFSEDGIYEDNVMMVRAINSAKRIINLDKCLYLYRKNNASSSSRSAYKTDRHYRDSLRAMRESVDCLRPRTEYTSSYLFDYYVQKIIVYYESRIPSKYKKNYIKEAVDILSHLPVQGYSKDISKTTKAILKLGLVSKRNDKAVRQLVKAKIALSNVRKRTV